MLGLSTLLLPPALARLCGTDGVFAILFGGVLTYLLSVAWNRYDTNVKQNDTSEQYYNTKVLKNTTMVILYRCVSWNRRLCDVFSDHLN